MNNDLNSTPDLASTSHTKLTKLVNQWGGKAAFFFTYTHFSHDLTTGLLAAMLPFIRDDLKLNYLQAGFLVSAFAITSGFSQWFGGWISDKIPRQKAIALGLGGVGLSAVALSLAHSYFVLMGILIIMGIMAGFYHPSAISTVSTVFEAKQRGRALALHMIGGSLGFGLGPFFGALIASRLNWHFTFAILGIPGIIASILVLTRFKIPIQSASSKNAAQQATTGIKQPTNAWQVFKPAIGIVAISVAMQLVTGPVISFASLFLIDAHQVSIAAGSMWMTMIRMGGLAGSLIGGWLSDKWGRQNTIFLTLALFGPVAFALARLPFGFGLAAAYVVFGALMSMRETTMQTFLMDNTPPKLRATVIGIYFGFGQQGSSIMQPIAGNLMDTWGISNFFIRLSYLSLGLSAAVIVIAVRYFKRGKPTETTTEP